MAGAPASTSTSAPNDSTAWSLLAFGFTPCTSVELAHLVSDGTTGVPALYTCECREDKLRVRVVVIASPDVAGLSGRAEAQVYEDVVMREDLDEQLKQLCIELGDWDSFELVRTQFSAQKRSTRFVDSSVSDGPYLETVFGTSEWPTRVRLPSPHRGVLATAVNAQTTAEDVFATVVGAATCAPTPTPSPAREQQQPSAAEQPKTKKRRAQVLLAKLAKTNN